jgi:hypothetical protein
MLLLRQPAHLALQVLHVALQLRDACLHFTFALLCCERFAHAEGYAALIQGLQHEV